MRTKILKLTNTKNPRSLNSKLKSSAKIIRSGGLVVFPTETVYGIGANGLDAKAVKKIFIAKGRPSDNPLIVHIADEKDLSLLVRSIPQKAKVLMKKFWPGPLTIILKKKSGVPSSVTAGLDSVAIRMPSNKIARSLIRLAKTPIAAPSANLSGRPSPTSAEHVITDLAGRVDMIIDGGQTKIGLESTVIDLTTKVPTILRPGKITLAQIKKVIGSVKLHKHKQNSKISKARSPGMKYRHYAPNAKLFVIKGNKNKVRNEIIKLVKQFKKQKSRVGIISFNYSNYRADLVKFFGKNYLLAAKSLYSTLRDFDKKKIDIILCESIPKKDFGLAIMDRLERAAGKNVIEII
ncbi:threonylcarbamoyl-AMP synthase [Candidatus Micrarchaeota archaeon]|nr:threonylcarbamoyl-AMP synthase [Candidatus Micrarchaeota archaeon]